MGTLLSQIFLLRKVDLQLFSFLKIVKVKSISDLRTQKRCMRPRTEDKSLTPQR